MLGFRKPSGGCAKCGGVKVTYVASPAVDVDDLSWTCAGCGYVESPDIRRTRRTIRRLLAMGWLGSIVGITLAAVVVISPALPTRDEWMVLGRHLAVGLLVLGLLLLVMHSVFWAVEQLRDGGLMGLVQDLARLRARRITRRERQRSPPR